MSIGKTLSQDSSPTRSPADVIAQVRVTPTELEPATPLCDSLEWRLAAAYWASAGAAAFVSGDVPYLVNNSGRLSENAAVLLFASLSHAPPPPGPIAVLEMGAGAGLFARYFLDAFRDVCAQERKDFYDRLTFVVSDRSPRAVSDWAEGGVFAGHEAHTVLLRGDAVRPLEIWNEVGSVALPAPRAVFCNYVLDVLSSSIVRRVDSGAVEELWVRTYMSSPPEVLRQYGDLSLDEVRARVGAPDDANLMALRPYWPLLELEVSFRPAAAAVAALADKLDVNRRVVLNHGAYAAVEQIMHLVDPQGFLLINDYASDGPGGADGAPPAVQRFGASVAVGLNFSLLRRHLEGRGLACVAPPGDPERAIHSRLIAHRFPPGVADTFANRFGLAADRHQQDPLMEARAHLTAGRTQEALDAFRVALERNSGDWQVMGEAAEYVGLSLRDYPSGVEMARAAVARNPWYSPWLWNVLGDCLFCADRVDEAHDAYLRAEQIDAGDPRTNLNLSFTLANQGHPEAALERVARGLGRDPRGLYRARLLERQAQILMALSARASVDDDRASKRLARFA